MRYVSCTGRKNDVTFEPVSDVLAHGGILTVMQTIVSDKLSMHIRTCA